MEIIKNSVSKRSYKNLNLDFKDRDGNWVGWIFNKTEYHYTRAGRLYHNLTGRCSELYQKRNPTYLGTLNKFNNFNDFAEWAQNQFGYLNTEVDGSFWVLDKDLITPYCNTYSTETCMFIPEKFNHLISLNNSKRSNASLPIGVFERAPGKFVAALSIDAQRYYSSNFNTPIEAHKEWQRLKINNILRMSKFEEIQGHTKLINCLIRIASNLQYDLDSNLITTTYR